MENSIVIHSYGCRCTDCIIGDSFPVGDLSDHQLLQIFVGVLVPVNHTGCKSIQITVVPNSISVVATDYPAQVKTF